MQKQNPLLRVWELGKSQHSGLICAVISAFLGVLGGMLPYFAAAQMIVNLLEGNRGICHCTSNGCALGWQAI